jgi:integrase
MMKVTMVELASRPKVRAVRSLPIRDWPAADRDGWVDACKPGQRLTRGGNASHLAPITQTDLARRYGYFLDFLARSGRLDLTAGAGTLVTLEATIPFVAELQARASSVTVSRTIYKLRRAAECIAPHRSFAWLAEIGRDLELLERPKDKFDRVVLTERLVEAGLTLFREAEADICGLPLSRALAARNGLMVALLAPCPIRLKNFVALEIGSTLLKPEEAWWIHLSETKSRRPDHRPVPTFLTGFLERYLEVYRPILLQQRSGKKDCRNLGTEIGQMQTTIASPGALWISRLGFPLKYGSVAMAVTETTRMTLGVPISPHLFRNAAATSAALHASKSPHLATALLHHTDEKTTEAHYIRASSLSVARDFAELIGDLRTP